MQPSEQEETRAAQVVDHYLRERKGWHPDQFRVESRGLDPEGRDFVVWGIWLDDERHPVPGSGQSVELYVDRASGQIRRELSFQ